jgi:hypothetical protein
MSYDNNEERDVSSERQDINTNDGHENEGNKDE